MRYGSVCSGIEAASVAWHPLGWRASFLSEIDKFPRAVLKHHYPEVPLHGRERRKGETFKAYGDACGFQTIRAGEYDPIDLLVGGTPCQSFSVAGLRGGLGDERGNLALEYLRLAQRLRPRWLVWENVPGVLSSAGGRDFGAILGGLVELGYGFAYRVLDAQYVRVDGFGRAVPQRRRRVFVVGHLGDWRRAAAVLFEPESLSGNTSPRRQAGEGIAPTISARPTGGGGLGTDFDLDWGCIPEVSLCLNAGGMGRTDYETETMLPVAHSLRADGFDASEDGTGRGTPIVPVAFAQNQRDELREMQVAGALAAEPGMKQQTYIAFSCKDHGADAGDTAPTLRAMGHAGSHANAGGQVAVAFVHQAGGTQTTLGYDPEAGTAPTLAKCQTPAVQYGWRVRRLTPTECERLQGFPDGYTDIPYRNRNWTPDGPRYKALGNSMAVNVMRWIGRRIEMVEATHAR